MSQPTTAPKALLHLDATCFSLTPLTLADITERLKAFSVEDTLRPLARVACALTNGKRKHSDQRWALNQFLSPQLLARATVELTSEQWIFISRRQLHLTYLLLATHGTRTEGPTRSLHDPHDRSEFGEILLHISSFLGEAPNDDSQNFSTVQDINPFKHETHAAVQLLRTAKSDQPVVTDIELVRGHRLLFHYLPIEYQRKGLSFDTLAASCFARLECEPQDLWRLAAAVLLSNLQSSGLTLQSQPGISRPLFFMNFEWDEARIDRTLSTLTTSLDQLSREYSRGSHRFPTCIDAKPLLQLAEDYVILDITSLACFLGSGIFDLIADSLRHEERQRFRDLFGLALESYARDIADAASRHSHCGSVILPTRPSEPGYDLIIRDRFVMSAIEVKADTFKPDYLTSKSSLVFANMISSSKTFFKAPKQLVAASQSVISGNDSITRLHLGVIGMDDAFAFMCVQQAFNEKFEQLPSTIRDSACGKYFVRPLVFSLREWEHVCILVASGKRFVDCFDAIISHDRMGEYTARMSLDWKNYGVTTLSDNFLGDALDDVVKEVASVLKQPDSA